MAKDELSVYEKIEKVLFLSTEDAQKYLTPSVLEIKNRLMLCVSVLMAEPMKEDTEIVNFLMNGCGGECEGISNSQAYRDVAALRKMVGSIQLSSKSWYRYMIIEGSKQGFEIAKKANDAKGMAACLDKIGKYTRADKEDEDFDWSQMIPPSFEPSDDVSLMENMEPIEDLEAKRKEFRAIFKNNLGKKAEEAVIEE
jgi:hypothetical protein